MNIKAEVRINERLAAYETHDVAKAALEIELPVGDTFDAREIKRAVDDLLDDLTNRIVDQLRLVQKQRDATRKAEEDAFA